MRPRDHERRSLGKRLSRVPTMVLFCGFQWVACSVYTLSQGYVSTSRLCIGEAVLAMLAFVVAARWKLTRRFVAHFNLFAIFCGVTVESICSGGIVSATPIAYAALGVLAAHQLGITSALAWSCAGVIGIFAVCFGYDPATVPMWRVPTRVDHVFIFSSLTALLYSICRQSEVDFERQIGQILFFADKMSEKTRLLNLAEETAGIGHWQLDVESQTLQLSSVASQLVGGEPTGGEFTVAEFVHHMSPVNRRAVRSALFDSSCRPSEFRLDVEIPHDNEVKYLTIKGFGETHSDELVHKVFGVLEDQTESRRRQQELMDLATVDSLTRLPNRNSFQIELQSSLVEADNSGARVAMLIADIDGFKQINDTMGHPTGDALLRRIAERLQESVGKDNYVARLGGDEFVILVKDFKSRLDVSILGGKIARNVSKPYSLEGKQLNVGLSVGAAVYPDDTTDPSQFMSFADTAMYHTKGRSETVGLYEPAMTEGVTRRHELENRLSTALQDEEFELWFQPQINVWDQTLSGFEALIRWQRDGEMVSPAEFIPILESTGRIIDVGRWVLFESCRQAKRWSDEGFDVGISVNISPIQFADPNFVPYVWSALDNSGLDPKRLDLELTESVLINEISVVASKLDLLKTTGTSISIDDFGTGYSSLAYLKHLPIDRIKIDRAFIKDIPNTDDGTIAHSMIVMSHNLGMHVLAEGVETEEQMRFLNERGCDQYQGYLFSKPVPAMEAGQLLRKSVLSSEDWYTEKLAVAGSNNAPTFEIEQVDSPVVASP